MPVCRGGAWLVWIILGWRDVMGVEASTGPCIANVGWVVEAGKSVPVGVLTSVLGAAACMLA